MTKIQWTTRTWNPLAGCSIVSPGCKNCYAMRNAYRLAQNPNPKVAAKYAGTTKLVKGKPVWTGTVNVADDETLMQPLRVKKPTIWFVNSMSDLFHENVPDEVIDRIFAVMALCPQHTLQVLTKRSARMRAYMESATGRIADAVQPLRTDNTPVGPLPHIEPGARWWPLPNVWFGVSVEDQTRADERIPDLLAIPAAIRFISAEPLLGPVDLTRWLPATGGAALASSPSTAASATPCLDWVIVGGESGSGARPIHPDWARSLRDQCAAAGVPFFFKQWGEHLGGIGEDMGDHLWFHAASHDLNSGVIETADQFGWFEPDKAPDGPMWIKLGVKAAGRLLDGVEHNAMPEGRHG